MSNEDYHANTDYISSSGVKLINRSPRHYWDRYLNPERAASTPSPAMQFGSLTHTMLCEPHLLEKDYFVFDDAQIIEELIEEGAKSPRATKKYKEWMEEYLSEIGEKTPMSQEDYDKARCMRDNVQKHPLLREHLSGTVEYELSHFFIDERTGARVRTRPDVDNGEVYMDFKTCDDAREESVRRAIMKYAYGQSAELYMRSPEKRRQFLFIFIEKEPPHDLKVYVCGASIYQDARPKNDANLRTFIQCQESGIWQGYSPNAEIIDIYTNK